MLSIPEQRQADAFEARRIREEHPDWTWKQVAKQMGRSAGYIGRCRRWYPEEDTLFKDVVDNTVSFFKDQDAFEEDMQEEVVKGYVVHKNKNSFFNAIPFEIRIPAGLSAEKRALVTHSIVFKDLKIVEI